MGFNHMVVILCWIHIATPLLFTTPALNLDRETNSVAPSDLIGAETTHCRIEAVRGYLKQICKILGLDHFKCEYSDQFYRLRTNKNRGTICDSEYTTLCSNDKIFYQACPYSNTCPRNMKHPSLECGYYVCFTHDFKWLGIFAKGIVRSGFETSITTRCNGYNDCSNTEMDEDRCASTEESELGCLIENRLILQEEDICNGECRCTSCSDEALCGDYRYGIFCRLINSPTKISYVLPSRICDEYKDCTENEDEIGCEDELEVQCRWGRQLLASERSTRVLRNDSRCSASYDNPRSYSWIDSKVCIEHEDQTNCSDPARAHLQCLVRGYPSTVSNFALCKEWDLCDDGMDSKCVQISPFCRLHQHYLCDGTQDCLGAPDELETFCGAVTTHKCRRKLSRDGWELPLHQPMILDKVEDCIDGSDEDVNLWTKECGTGSETVYKIDSQVSDCLDEVILTCRSGAKIKGSYLCKSSNNCDRNMCVVSRGKYDMTTPVKMLTMGGKSEPGEAGAARTHYFILHCLPGLHNLKYLSRECQSGEFYGHETNVFGVTPRRLLYPRTLPDYLGMCDGAFGELYVYLHCLGLCPESQCPLLRIDRRSCSNLRDSVYTVANNDHLVVAVPVNMGRTGTSSTTTYDSNLFRCDNYNCLTYDRVCNLVDDCGDASDELNCTNNFRCGSREFIPRESKCDGEFNCLDFSDECNDDCNTLVETFSHVSLKIIGSLVGFLIIVFNIGAIANSICQILKSKSTKATINRIFIVLICFGDLLMGFYLLIAAIADTFANNSTCQTQFEWTSSWICEFIGVISTVGSLLSLLSMTVLSLIRAQSLLKGSLVAPEETLNQKKKAQLSLGIGVMFLVCLAIAMVPLLVLEDYFVREYNFGENRLFVGAPTMDKLQKILKEHYRALKDIQTWKEIRNLIRIMFNGSDDITVKGKRISFYGSDGFCLFKYYTRHGDRSLEYSLAVLVFVGVCVALTTVAYILIQYKVIKSRRAAVSSTSRDSGSTGLQWKIAFLIGTNIITWTPFVVVCFVHFLEISDTVEWYGVFSIIILPLNSFINPLGLYDEFFSEFFSKIIALCSWNQVSNLAASSNNDPNGHPMAQNHQSAKANKFSTPQNATPPK